MSYDGDHPPSLRDFLPKKYAPGRNDLCPCQSGKKYKKCCGTPNMNRINGMDKEPKIEGEPRFLIDVGLAIGPHPDISPLGANPVPDVSLYVANVRVVHGPDASRYREMKVRGRVLEVFPILDGAPTERVSEPEEALSELFSGIGKVCGDYVTKWRAE